jgi:two-component system KDP operon response regulator KdpE
MAEWNDLERTTNNWDPDYKIMLICDDPDISYVWAHILRKRAMSVFSTDSRVVALNHKKVERPDLVVIDESTTALNAIPLIKDLRDEAAFPIILFTSFTSENYILDAYKAGVDDCVSKPVSPAIFIARVQALLRRVNTVPMETMGNLRVNGYRLDPTRREIVDHNGKATKLSQLEFRLLQLFMQNPGLIYKPEDIVSHVWGYEGEGSTQLLKHLIFRLRRKIEADPKHPKHIRTEPGIGYVFEKDSGSSPTGL